MTPSGHHHLLPYASEQIDFDDIDTLLDQLLAMRFNPAASPRLICDTIATLIAGIRQQPHPISRVRGDNSTPTNDIRWLQLALGDEIDRVLTLLWADTEPPCHYCLQQWSLHLLSARAIVKDWAWARETEEQLRSSD